MKKIFMSGLALAVMSFTTMTFAKSRSKSHKSSGKSSQNTSSKQKTAAPDKQSADATSDKKNQHNKNRKMHRCRLPDGKIDTNMTQQECLKVNGKWVKH